MKEKSWLDDPEWEKLQRRVDKNPSWKKTTPKRKPQIVDGLSYAPPKPRPRVIQQQQLKKEIKTTEKRRQNDNKKVHLSLVIPVPKLHLPTINPKYLKVGVSLLIAIILVGLFVQMRSGNKVEKPSQDAANQSTSQTPEFETILPGGKSEQVNGGEVRYDMQKKIVNYRDQITGVDVTVSQQSLPASFKQAADTEVEKIAKNFSADKIVYAGEVKAFSGVSEQGPQTIIFSKKNLLLFIYAPKELDRDGLVKYIIELQ